MLVKHLNIIFFSSILCVPLLSYATPHQIEVIPNVFERVYMQHMLSGQQSSHEKLSLVKLMYYDMEKSTRSVGIDSRKNLVQQGLELIFKQMPIKESSYYVLHPAVNIFNETNKIDYCSSIQQQNINLLFSDKNLQTYDMGAWQQAQFSYDEFGPSLSRALSADPAEPFRHHVITLTVPLAGPALGHHNLQNLKRIQGIDDDLD